MKSKSELKKQIEALQAEYDAMPDDAEPLYWVPKRDDGYYFSDEFGKTRHTTFYLPTPSHVHDITTGQYSRTNEEEKQRIEAMKVLHELRIMASDAWAEIGQVPDWSNSNQAKYFPRYNWNIEGWYPESFNLSQLPIIPCFPSEEAFFSARNKLGDRMMSLLGKV